MDRRTSLDDLAGRKALLQALAAGLALTLLASLIVVPAVLSSRPPDSAPTMGPTVTAVAVGAREDPSQTTPTVQPTLAPPVSFDPSRCGSLVVNIERAAASLQQEASTAQGVILGSIEGVDSVWSTPDGKAPQRPLRPTDVYSTLAITISANPKAATSTKGLSTAVNSRVHVRVLGGTVDCRSVVISGQAKPRVGGKVVVFLSKKQFNAPKTVPVADFDASNVLSADDGTVIQPDGSKISLATFEAQAAAAK
jgi:hypothetical protein